MAIKKAILDKLNKRRGKVKLTEKSVLYFEGKPTKSKTEIRTIVKKLGCTYTTKLDKKVTHVIIGDQAEDSEILNRKYKLLSEKELYELESIAFPKFITEQIKEGNTNSVQGVMQFLESPDIANVKIGLTMLEKGGVPEDVLEPLILIAKTFPDAKTRDKAKKLVILNGPPEWKAIAESKVLFKTMDTTAKEKDVFGKLFKMANEKGIEAAAIFSLILYKKYKKGLRLIVMHKLIAAEWKQKAYELLMDDGHFNFSSAVGFKNWKNIDPSEYQIWPYKEKTNIPTDILQYHTVNSICLHNIKISAIPRELSKYTDLKKIDLSFNFIKSFPPYFARLKNLEELDLTWNMFETFPVNLIKHTKLKKVDLRYCGRTNEYISLEVPDEVKAALPNCEFIV